MTNNQIGISDIYVSGAKKTMLNIEHIEQNEQMNSMPKTLTKSTKHYITYIT